MLSSQVVGTILLGTLGLVGGVLLGQIYLSSTALRAQRELKGSRDLPVGSGPRLYSVVILSAGLIALVAGGEAFAIRAVWQRYLAAPATPPHRMIAYVSDQNGSNDIGLMDEYGHTRALTFSMANEREPHWSPDGQWIAFVSNQEGNDDIFLISPEGHSIRQLTHTPEDEGWISWSPDGRSILFTREAPTEKQLCVVNVDQVEGNATGERCIFKTDGQINKPSFSPDGQEIAFNFGHNGWFQLWLINSDGTDARALDPTTQSGIAAWSPDEKRIVYRVATDYNKPSDVQIISLDDMERHHVHHIEASQVQANWSPDGQKLYFTSDPSDPPLEEMGRLGIMNADGSKLIWLDDGINWVYGQSQSWQIETWDENNRILYSHQEAGQYDLYLINADGTHRMRLTFGAGNKFHAVFRPVPPLKQR